MRLVALCLIAALLVSPARAQPAPAEGDDPDVGLQALLDPLGDKSAQRAIGAISTLVNVFPGRPPTPNELADVVSISAARNEHESAQIVVSAGPEALRVEKVTVSDLRYADGDHVIAADQTEVRLVGYANVTTSSWRSTKQLGLFPDPLLKLRPFVCPAQQARCLWLTVHVPTDAAPGIYEGTIELASETDRIAELPIELRVYDFALPHMPRLHTSYWNHFVGRYDAEQDRELFDQMLQMFGAYRISTNVHLDGDIVVSRHDDASITCDWEGMKRHLELGIASGFRTLNIGPGGCWGDTWLMHNGNMIEQVTGRWAPHDVWSKYPPGTVARAYLQPLADWLEERGLLERAYLQIRDEQMDPGLWKINFMPEVELFRRIEPRIQLSSVLGIHPSTQGLFDIWSPHEAFFDRRTYAMVRQGISLYGRKNFKAKVTASSTGGWGNAAFYNYQPLDAYDGCDYTQWIPAKAPTPDEPQWLRFDFNEPQEIDGIRLIPFGRTDNQVTGWVEVSRDGRSFEPAWLKMREDGPNQWSFDANEYQAIRLMWTHGDRPFVATEQQPLAPPGPRTVGVREVEFLQAGLELEETHPRKKVRPVKMMWEYQVDADYPGVCIDNDPAEPRATGWQCWMRHVDGYLNYGAAQWQMTDVQRPKSEDPLVWPGRGNGGPMIVYPGADEVLPSLRFARFRDGVDDFDYLYLLDKQQPDHPLLAELRRQSGRAYATGRVLQTNRRAVAEALENE